MARRLEALHPGLSVELVPIVTRGDVTPGDLSAVGGKGLFTEELEAGLRDGTFDLAVHSLKDLPVRLPDGLVVVAFPEREDPRDVLLSDTAQDLDSLEAGDAVLTGSLRRRAQILRHRPDVRVVPVRGNVDTRIRKWREGPAAGVILAAAGLRRLGNVADVPAHALDPELVVPAPGQGTLAVETRADGEAAELCRALDHPPTRRTAVAERLIVEAYGADCTLPLGAWCRHDGDALRLLAVLATPDGVRLARGEGRGPSPEAAAEACLAALDGDGAREVRAELDR